NSTLCFLNKLRYSSSNVIFLWCSFCRRTYWATLSNFDSLTLKALYPFCQAKARPFSFIHFEEFAFNKLIALDIAMVGGKWKSRCTWLSVPLIAIETIF